MNVTKIKSTIAVALEACRDTRQVKSSFVEVSIVEKVFLLENMLSLLLALASCLCIGAYTEGIVTAMSISIGSTPVTTVLRA